MPLKLRRRFGRSHQWQEVVSLAYVLGLGYLLRQRTAYWLFDSMLRRPNYQRAGAILTIASRRYPNGDDVSSMQCTLALHSGDLNRGLRLLTTRIERGDLRAVDRILFRTGSRPSDFSQCSKLLDAIAASEGVELTQRCYARIAKAYLTLRSCDKHQASTLRPQLRELIEELTSLPESTSCPRGNRNNITKLLVSLQTASYHLALQSDDLQACTQIWREMLSFAEHIDFSRINTDAGLRMTSNLCRCLALGALIDPRQDPRALATSAEAITSLEKALAFNGLCATPKGRYKPQENHLQLLEELKLTCQHLMHPQTRDATRDREQYASLINHSSNRDLNRVITDHLESVSATQAGFTSCFRE